MKTIIFFGGGKLLINLVKITIKKKIKCIVFTSPRHSKEIITNNSNLKNCLKKINIVLYIKKRFNEKFLQKKIKDNNCIGVSIGSPWIFKKNIIKIFKSRFYNIHGANLPQNRGGGGFSWQILQNNILGYSCLHLVNEKIDNGDIIQTYKFNTKNCKNPIDWQDKYNKVSSLMFKKNLNNLFKKKGKIKKQLRKNSTYWPRLDTQTHGWINWNWPGKEIFYFIKAFDNPYLGAHTQLNKKTVYFKNCKFIKSKNFHPFQFGLIINKSKNSISVCVSGGIIEVKEIFNKNRKKENLKKFKIGDRFHTPMQKLEKALTKRVFFNL